MSATKRLLAELKEIQTTKPQDFTAHHVDDNIFNWHFTIRGPDHPHFKGGIYHGRITFPPDYPFKPPDIFFLTPNGRFQVNKKICLSITSYHPEFWRPAWGVSTALTALRGFMTTDPEGAVGALDYDEETRQELAKKSQEWKCEICGSDNKDALPEEEQTQSEEKPEEKQEKNQEKIDSEPSETQVARDNVKERTTAEKTTENHSHSELKKRTKPIPRINVIIPTSNTRNTQHDTLIILLIIFMVLILIRRVVGVLF